MKNNIFIIAIFAIIAITSAGVFGFMNGKTSQNRSITINNANGKATGTTDSATLYFTIETQDISDETATKKVNEAKTKIEKSMADFGIDKEKIVLENTDTWFYEDKKTIRINYKLEIEKENIENIEKIIKNIFAIENAYIVNLQKKTSTEEELKAKSRQNALENGEAQAREIAEKMGVKLGKILYINNGYNNWYTSSNYMHSLTKETTKQEIDTFLGETEVNSEFSLVYEIK